MSEFISAERMSAIREIVLKNRDEELKQRVMNSDYYKTLVEEIYAAANNGERHLNKWAMPKERIQEYMENHTIVPHDMLGFTTEQSEVLEALRTFGGFMVGIQSIPFAYEDGSSDSVSQANIYW